MGTLKAMELIAGIENIYTSPSCLASKTGESSEIALAWIQYLSVFHFIPLGPTKNTVFAGIVS